jgi:hypothetical protein
MTNSTSESSALLDAAVRAAKEVAITAAISRFVPVTLPAVQAS